MAVTLRPAGSALRAADLPLSGGSQHRRVAHFRIVKTSSARSRYKLRGPLGVGHGRWSTSARRATTSLRTRPVRRNLGSMMGRVPQRLSRRGRVPMRSLDRRPPAGDCRSSARCRRGVLVVGSASHTVRGVPARRFLQQRCRSTKDRRERDLPTGRRTSRGQDRPLSRSDEPRTARAVRRPLARRIRCPNNPRLRRGRASALAGRRSSSLLLAHRDRRRTRAHPRRPGPIARELPRPRRLPLRPSRLQPDPVRTVTPRQGQRHLSRRP